ncbi:hypothetical protein CQ046_06950 [Chryseobacterium sp. MYb7]|nr:hypothetical protein CQ046_06950 [Chryseobacterium sp. MYb7]
MTFFVLLPSPDRNGYPAARDWPFGQARGVKVDSGNKLLMIILIKDGICKRIIKKKGCFW